MHYTVSLFFFRFQSFCSMNEVTGHISIKYACNHIFSFWALHSYEISTPTLLGKTFPADREIRMTQQGEPGAGLPFKIQQQKWQDTFETQHSESRRKETLLLSWHAKCQCKLLTLLRRRKAVVSSSWRWRGSASVIHPFAAAIKAAAKLRSLITSHSVDETLNTSPCYHACVCRHCGKAVQYKKISILKQGSCIKLLIFWEQTEEEICWTSKDQHRGGLFLFSCVTSLWRNVAFGCVSTQMRSLYSHSSFLICLNHAMRMKN